MRPTARLAGAVLLGAVLYLYGATSEVVWLFLLAYWAWALAAGMLIYAIWNRDGVSGEVRLSGFEPSAGSPVADLPESVLRSAPPPGPLFEGDTATVSCVLRSRKGSRGPAQATAEVAGEALRAGAGVVTPAGVSAARSGLRLRRGVLGAGPVAVETSDPLGLYRSRRLEPERDLALVYPRFAALAPDPQLREVEASVAAPRAGSGSEVVGVREYRPGDPLRRIHWRLSARRGGLVVREFEPPGLRTLLIVLDSRPDPEAADQAARIAASEVWDCLRGGGRVALWSPGLEPAPPDRDLWPLLAWLARWPDLPSESGDVARVGEVIAVTTTGEAVAEIEHLRRRGAASRAWAVGPRAAVAVEVPIRTATLEWPL